MALTASLRFQPTKRPQQASTAAAAAKAKAKAVASKFSAPQAVKSTSEPRTDAAQATAAPPQPVAPKTSIADWAGKEDDEDYFQEEKRQRGGRKKRKKNKEAVEVIRDWDDIYDPSRPNSYEEYKHSEEKAREIGEWKDLLYRHRIRRRDSSEYDSEREERPMHSWSINGHFEASADLRLGQFAPPMSFAPPANLNDERDRKSVV